MEQLDGWGWPGVAAQVHFRRFLNARRAAGDGRESPLKYTVAVLRPCCASRWGWPGVAAQVHLSHLCSSTAEAGDGRESPLKYTSERKYFFVVTAGDGRESPLKYTTCSDTCF